MADEITFPIEAGHIMRFAAAIGDENPIYFDEVAAQAAGYRTLVAPPTYVTHAVVQPRTASDLRTDGLYREGTRIRLQVDRVMFGGEEWDFLEPVCVGDEITAIVRLAAVDQKEGRKGPFVRQVRETTFVNQFGDEVARSRMIGIAR